MVELTNVISDREYRLHTGLELPFFPLPLMAKKKCHRDEKSKAPPPERQASGPRLRRARNKTQQIGITSGGIRILGDVRSPGLFDQYGNPTIPSGRVGPSNVTAGGSGLNYEAQSGRHASQTIASISSTSEESLYNSTDSRPSTPPPTPSEETSLPILDAFANAGKQWGCCCQNSRVNP
jgi:hypothetical protein